MTIDVKKISKNKFEEQENLYWEIAKSRAKDLTCSNERDRTLIETYELLVQKEIQDIKDDIEVKLVRKHLF